MSKRLQFSSKLTLDIQSKFIQVVVTVTHRRAILTLDTKHCQKSAFTATVYDREIHINLQHNMITATTLENNSRMLHFVIGWNSSCQKPLGLVEC